MPFPPLPGTGRKVQIGDGYEVTVTEAMQQACNYATSDMILDREYPGEGFRARMIASLEVLKGELRRQIPFVEWDDSTRLGRVRLAEIAKWLGSWDVERGHAKSSASIVPVRSVMDILMTAECAPHGLIHDCKGA